MLLGQSIFHRGSSACPRNGSYRHHLTTCSYKSALLPWPCCPKAAACIHRRTCDYDSGIFLRYYHHPCLCHECFGCSLQIGGSVSFYFGLTCHLCLHHQSYCCSPCRKTAGWKTRDAAGKRKSSACSDHFNHLAVGIYLHLSHVFFSRSHSSPQLNHLVFYSFSFIFSFLFTADLSLIGSHHLNFNHPNFHYHRHRILSHCNSRHITLMSL